MASHARGFVDGLRAASARWADARPIERGFVVAAWLLAPAASASLRGLGVGRVTRALRALDALPLHATPASLLDPERAEQLVRWAYLGHPLLTHGCLPASVVQYGLQRALGDDVRLVVGARRAAGEPTVDAHAWVERTGLERSAERERFEVLLELGGEAPRRPRSQGGDGG